MESAAAHLHHQPQALSAAPRLSMMLRTPIANRSANRAWRAPTVRSANARAAIFAAATQTLPMTRMRSSANRGAPQTTIRTTAHAVSVKGVRFAHRAHLVNHRSPTTYLSRRAIHFARLTLLNRTAVSVSAKGVASARRRS